MKTNIVITNQTIKLLQYAPVLKFADKYIEQIKELEEKINPNRLLFDKLTLTDEQFDEKYIVYTGPNLTSKAGKEEYALFDLMKQEFN